MLIMRLIIVLLIWVTPAIIAEMLGWKGIWGSGSALVDYLIPIPVAGGVLHVPGFVIAALVVLKLDKWDESVAQWIPLVALAILLLALTLQLELDSLNAWLFTDFEPGSSMLRFGENPLLLFIATDALWVALYSLLLGNARKLRYILILPLVPLITIGAVMLSYKTTAPEFRYGISVNGEIRGDEIDLIYTQNSYNEQQFRDWLNSASNIMPPWDSIDAGHQAVLFTRSMQAVEYGKVNDFDNIVATICRYEENREVTVYSGYADCFIDRRNFNELMQISRDNTDTGLGRELDDWYAQAKLCDGLQVPEGYIQGIEVIDWCRRLRENFASLQETISVKYGLDSPQVEFVRSHAGLIDAN